MLVIACGAGVTAGAASIDPRVERETIAEIEPLVPQAAAKYFGDYNFNVVKNPKVHVEIDDARHFLNTTKEKFDAITSDPFDPWVKGAANLYTTEFWEMAKAHLNPGGVVTVFVQLYLSGLAASKSEVATFFQVFPTATIWGNPIRGVGYDIVLMGRVERARSTSIGCSGCSSAQSSTGRPVAAPDWIQLGDRSAVDLRGAQARAQPLAGRRGDQPRRQLAVAVSGRLRPQPRPARADLPRAALLPAVSGRSLRRQPGQPERVARSDPQEMTRRR